MIACALLTGSLAAGCGEDAVDCNDMDVAAVVVTIENGVYGEECAYEVSTTTADGTAASVDCWTEGPSCICAGGSVGRNTVRLIGRYRGETRVLDTQEVVVEEGECHPITEEVTFERPPIEEFVIQSCADAAAMLNLCERGHVIDLLECTDTTIEPGEAPGSEPTNCAYDCIADAECDTIQATFCPDGAGGAPDGVGGAGGAGGEASGPTSLITCAVECDAGLGTEKEAAADAARMCPGDQ